MQQASANSLIIYVGKKTTAGNRCRTI